MVKYVDTRVVFEEVPDCVSLGISISNCPFSCPGCHSPYLREDCGEVLDEGRLDALVRENSGVNCVLFMGDGNDADGLCALARHVRGAFPGMKTAVYSGMSGPMERYLGSFDYIKTGRYDEKYGALDSETTNQRFYENSGGELKDITYKFWER